MLHSKVMLSSFGLLMLFAAGPAAAQQAASDAPSTKAEESMPGTLTGSVGINSDYVSRGISQTANGPAVMGSVDWSFDTGYRGTSVYVGAFAANVDFPGSGANLETDFLAGVRGSTKKIDWDFGYAYYRYHGATSSLNMDYSEIIAKAAHDFDVLKLSGQVNYAPSYSGDTGTGVYLSGRIDKPLPYKLAAFASLGHQWIDDNTLAGVPDYYDWSVGISRPVWKFNLSLTYTDTNLSKSECYAQAYGNVCSARAVAGIALPF